MAKADPSTLLPPSNNNTHKKQKSPTENVPIANWLARQHSIKTMSSDSDSNSNGRSLKVSDFRFLLIFMGVFGAGSLFGAQVATSSQEVQTATEKNVTLLIENVPVQEEVPVPVPLLENNLWNDTSSEPQRETRRVPMGGNINFGNRTNRMKFSRQQRIEKGWGPQKATIPPLTTNFTPICLTDDCIQATASSLARAFPVRLYSDRSEWCNPTRLAQNDGVCIVRVPKSASSTSSGVALRIAARNKCGKVIIRDHIPGKRFRLRNPKTSFLMTSIRYPGQRLLSFIQFKDVSINRIAYDKDEDWMHRVYNNTHNSYGNIGHGQGGYALQFTSLEQIPKYSVWHPDAPDVVQNQTRVIQRVQDTINNYDFMLVVERMDESLVALALTMGVDLGDVLVTDAKTAGASYYFYRRASRECSRVVRADVPDAVYEYLRSDRFRAQNYGDYLLHAVANQSLDLTIEQLGRERFDAALEQFRALQQKERELCAPQAKFPCSSTGKPQIVQSMVDCYQNDFGCGYKCIDQMLKEEKESLSNNTTTSS